MHACLRPLRKVHFQGDMAVQFLHCKTITKRFRWISNRSEASLTLAANLILLSSAELPGPGPGLRKK